MSEFRPLGYDANWYDNGPGSEHAIREAKKAMQPKGDRPLCCSPKNAAANAARRRRCNMANETCPDCGSPIDQDATISAKHQQAPFWRRYDVVYQCGSTDKPYHRSRQCVENSLRAEIARLTRERDEAKAALSVNGGQILRLHADVAKETELIRAALGTVQAENAKLRAVVEQLHPRVFRLIEKGRKFIVIGEHEPYFIQAYQLIRNRELETRTWTDGDEAIFREAADAARNAAQTKEQG